MKYRLIKKGETIIYEGFFLFFLNNQIKGIIGSEFFLILKGKVGLYKYDT